MHRVADFGTYGYTHDWVELQYAAAVVYSNGIVHDPEQGRCFQRICVPCARSVLGEALERIQSVFVDI